MSEIAVRESTELEQPRTLFRTDEPSEIVTRASSTANALSAVVKKQRLTTRIQGRDHVRVEGWTLLGTMLGVFPVLVWSREVENGWEARVEAKTLAGHVVGAAEAMCLRSERTWANRDDYALRSMAQTRATSKALRQPLGFVMTLAGFDATPAEEMVVEASYEVLPPALAPEEDDRERASLVGEILRLADTLGKLDAKSEEISRHRGEHTSDAHLKWLRSQLTKARKAADAAQADAAAAAVADLPDEGIEFAPDRPSVEQQTLEDAS